MALESSARRCRQGHYQMESSLEEKRAAERARERGGGKVELHLTIVTKKNLIQALKKSIVENYDRNFFRLFAAIFKCPKARADITSTLSSIERRPAAQRAYDNNIRVVVQGKLR